MLCAFLKSDMDGIPFSAKGHCNASPAYDFGFACHRCRVTWCFYNTAVKKNSSFNPSCFFTLIQTEAVWSPSVILDSMPPLQRLKKVRSDTRQNLLCFLFCFSSLMEPQCVILDLMPSYSEAKKRVRGIRQRRHLVFLLVIVPELLFNSESPLCIPSLWFWIACHRCRVTWCFNMYFYNTAVKEADHFTTVALLHWTRQRRFNTSVWFWIACHRSGSIEKARHTHSPRKILQHCRQKTNYYTSFACLQ